MKRDRLGTGSDRRTKLRDLPVGEERGQRKEHRDRTDGERAPGGETNRTRSGEQSRRQVKLERLRIGSGHQAHPPDYIITGAQKGGTTTLFRYLCQHPESGPTLRKEIHYFSWHYAKGMPWYLSHFPESGGFSVVGEASASYLSDPDVPRRIRHALPDVKLIALLRNPIDRAFSQYQMNVRKDLEALTFERAIEEEPARLAASPDTASTGWRHASYLIRGHYADQLKIWYSAFPPEQLHIVQSEAFFANPREELARVLRFLELPAWQPDDFEIHNQGDYADMLPETRTKLAAYYVPLNQELYELLGYEFDWDHV